MACSLPGRLGPCRKVGRHASLRTLPARPLHHLYRLLLVPLVGHSEGHCGVAVKSPEGCYTQATRTSAITM
jgi:hypothetical protein